LDFVTYVPIYHADNVHHLFNHRLKKNHMGKYLAEELEKCLKEFGISNRVRQQYRRKSIIDCLNLISQILGQVCDNASNNDTMLTELEFLIPNGASGVHTHIRCICHIINLVVKVRIPTQPTTASLLFKSDFDSFQAILSQFTSKKTGKNSIEEDLDDDDILDEKELEAAAEVDPEREAHDVQEIDEIEKELEESLEALDQTEEDVALGKRALRKVRLCPILFRFFD